MDIQQDKDIVVIGAGLTGLTLAHYLHKRKADFTVLERSEHVGGVIQTVRTDGFLFERGPNTGVIGNDFVPELFDELTQYCQLQVADKSANKRYVLKNGKWEALPAGLIGGIKTPLFTFGDKLRVLGEPFRKPGTNPNETLDQFVMRRLGKSFLNYAVDPFILGIYAGDPSYLVPRFALPKLYNLEQKYGSFIGGSIKLAKEKKKSGVKSRATREIFSSKGGLQNLIQALFQSAGKENFLTAVNQIKVQPNEKGFLVTGTIAGDAVTIQAKKVVTTIGAHEVPNVLPFIDQKDQDAISNLLYAKVIQVALGFKTWDGMKLDGFGGLIPHRENRKILGVLFPSTFFPDRAPKGGALLSVFMGGVRRPELIDKTDDEIKQLVEKEVSSLMGLKTFNPDVYHIFRYQHAIPQYGIDCEARFSAIESVQKKYPGLIIGGNLRNGIGMADRIKQGHDLAEIELLGDK